MEEYHLLQVRDYKPKTLQTFSHFLITEKQWEIWGLEESRNVPNAQS